MKLKKSWFALALAVSLSLAGCTTGSTGSQGPAGSDGTNGVDGKDGSDGTDGKDGQNGATWYSGSAMPSDGLGNAGDFYLRTDTWDVYKKDATLWNLIGNIKGATGATGPTGIAGVDGCTWLSGDGAPTSDLGKNGDFYLNATNFDIYKKSSDAWTLVGNIKGTDGKDSVHYGETHTVTYHVNGGTMPEGAKSSLTVNWGDTLNLPCPTKLGYIFDGWFTGDTINDGQFYNKDCVFSDLDLYAHWLLGTYTVTLNLNGGTYSGSNTIQVKYKEALVLPDETQIKRTSYAFTGWYSGDTKWDSGVSFTYGADVTLTAKWEELQTFTITLNLNGGTYSGSTSIDAEYNATYILPSSGVSKTNYVFAGWYCGETFWNCNDVYNLKDNVTLAAKWEILTTYSIKLDLNGGTGVSELTQSFTNATKYTVSITLPTPTKANYSFKEYVNGTRNITDSSGKIICWDYFSSDVTLKAQWSSSTLLGDVLDFGKYPQSLVEDPSLISALNLVKKTNDEGFIEYNNEEYAKLVYEQSYKGYMSMSRRVVFIKHSTYYFKVEPIEWRVMTGSGTTTGTLLSKYVLTNSCFYTGSENRNIGGNVVYANNYEYSTLRALLNGYDGSSYGVSNFTGLGFLDKAFSVEENSKIVSNEVDNSASTTDSDDSLYFCNNTIDKIFALSFKDYSSNLTYIKGNFARKILNSDYARASGTQTSMVSSTLGVSYWTNTRSPYSGGSERTHYLSQSGDLDGSGYYFVSIDSYGVQPAMKINLEA